MPPEQVFYLSIPVSLAFVSPQSSLSRLKYLWLDNWGSCAFYLYSFLIRSNLYGGFFGLSIRLVVPISFLVDMREAIRFPYIGRIRKYPIDGASKPEPFPTRFLG